MLCQFCQTKSKFMERVYLYPGLLMFRHFSNITVMSSVYNLLFQIGVALWECIIITLKDGYYEMKKSEVLFIFYLILWET